MRPEIELKSEFVEFIPDELEDRTLYVAAKYRTVVHLCCCGCGRKVVTPLSPAAWKLTFDGVSITLLPSVGNWKLPCKSHYWIERNRVNWARMWSQSEIEAGRASEAQAIAEFYGEEPAKTGPQPDSQVSNAGKSAFTSPAIGLWSKIWRRLFG